MKRASERELLDAPAAPRLLAENFDDIETVNRLLGGIRAIRSAVSAHRPRSLLDVGAGSGDVLRAFASSDRERRFERLTGVDLNADIVRLGRERCTRWPGITLLQADGARLPFPDGSFDVAMCNLTLHHLDPEDAVAVLAELRRVSRRSPVVCDLVRSAAAYAGARVLALFTRNPLTKHDAPLSVRRAYTIAEALDLASAARWRAPRARRAPFFRFLMDDAAN